MQLRKYHNATNLHSLALSLPHQKKQKYDRKTMTCHESLQSLASGEDVNFVLLPRFLIVECELLSPLEKVVFIKTNI